MVVTWKSTFLKEGKRLNFDITHGFKYAHLECWHYLETHVKQNDYKNNNNKSYLNVKNLKVGSGILYRPLEIAETGSCYVERKIK